MWENILKILQRYGDVYLEGLAGTLWIAALTVVAGTVIGIILAVFRLGKCRPCEWFVRFYIWIIRGTPSLLQLYFFYLFLPKVLPIEISETESVVIALIISAGAYVSEIIRAGIQAVDPGQTEAASCLGLSRAQTLRFIILPQNSLRRSTASSAKSGKKGFTISGMRNIPSTPGAWAFSNQGKR